MSRNNSARAKKYERAKLAFTLIAFSEGEGIIDTGIQATKTDSPYASIASSIFP